MYTPLKARLKELGLADPFGEGKTLSENANLDGMKEWINKASLAILEKEKEINEQALNNQQEVKEEQETLEEIKTKAKPVIDKANKSLAEAINAEPKLKIERYDNGNGDEYVKLPDGREIAVERNNHGEIIAVYIDADNDTRVYDVIYSSEAAYVDIDNSNDNFEFGLSNDRYDFEKVLELAKRIFG